MSSKLATFPATFDIATPELIPLGVDFASRLGVGETIASVVSRTVTHVETATVVTAAISGSASVTGSVVTQTIDPSVLTRGDQYEYVVTVAIGTRHESTITKLKVLF